MRRSGGRSDSAVRLLTGRPWVVVGAWALFFLALTPVALSYTHSINYGATSAGLSGTESDRAAALLASISPANATLLIVVDTGSLNSSDLAAKTLGLEGNLSRASLPYFAGTSSAFSSYSAYLDGIFGAEVPVVRSVGGNVTALADAVYGFPAAFLTAWTAAGGAQGAINSSFTAAGGVPSGYDAVFASAVAQNFSGSTALSEQVQAAVLAAAPACFGASPDLPALLDLSNVTSYVADLPGVVASIVSLSAGTAVPVSWVRAALAAGDFGPNYVGLYGLSGAPSFLTDRFISPDGGTSLLFVTFSVTDSFREADGTYPAQAATPAVRSAADRTFQGSAIVTGQGAAAYDSQQLVSASGALFALVFVLLAAAVALTLRSWVAPLLALAFVSLSTVLGYLAIELAAGLVGKVDFTVTYTVTAVTLGIATDYLLFLAYRFREELTRGAAPEEALRTATGRSGFAILVSAATVAVGLGSLSFLPGLETWGPTLAVTVLLIAVLEVTLLPALLRLVGPRLFLARWMRPAGPWERSVFYRAAARSTSRPATVALLAAVVAVPAVAGFLFVPTTYDISAVQSTSTPSSVGLTEVQHAFGANLLYPTYVIVTASGSFLASNGSLSGEGLQVLPGVASDLLGHPGVASVDGPFAAGTNLSGSVGATAFVFDGGHHAYYLLYSMYGPYSSAAISLVGDLRSNSSYLVGGTTSSVIDQQARNSVEFPTFELVLTVLIAAILGLSFRSAAVPAISLSGVFLSISATTGLLALFAEYVLHQPLLYIIPLILFVILMSLGNDYTVFLIARVREEQGTAGRREGIHRGIAGSGVVVSALGLILAASLGSLGLQPLVFLQELGLAFVVSLLVDTFLVRPFYFPAMLELLGRRRRSEVGDPRLPE